LSVRPPAWSNEAQRIREESERERQRIRDEIEIHRKDAHAHAPLMDRVLREGYLKEKEAQDTHDEFDERISALEAFKAQVILLGGIALILLGAIAYPVIGKLITNLSH